MKKISCPICHKQTVRYYFKSNETLYYRCTACNLVFTDQVKTLSYANWEKSENYQKWEDYLKNVFLRRVREIKKYKSTGRVLEIGSSLGYMMEVFIKEGFKVEGIEPSLKAVKLAKSHGLVVSKGYFETSNFRDNSFDIVVVNHVLEHIKKPDVFLRKIARVLKRRGIVFIELPNFGSLEAQLFKSKWRFLMPNEHYFQYTPRTLSLMMEKNGFKVVQIQTKGFFNEFGDMREELIRCIKSDRKRLIYYMIEFFPELLQHFVNRNSGLQIIARNN